MSKLAQAKAAAAEVKAIAPDMTQKVSGGGAKLLPEGWTFARMVEYIEFGNQPQEFNGKAKDPQLEAQIGFALYDTAGRDYSNDDGSPYVVRLYPMAVHRNEKARAFKLFAAMNWRKMYTHFAEMLGDAYLVYIKHEPKSKTDQTIVSRIDIDKIMPPLDQMSGQAFPIPEARDEDIKYFLWDKPTKETWADLFIEGKFDDGKSKNILQEKCLGATNFEGSALQQLLNGASGLALPSASEVAQVNPTLPAQPAETPSTPANPAGGTMTASSVSTPAQPASTTTSPSNVAMPSFPAMPAMPSFPAVPQ